MAHGKVQRQCYLAAIEDEETGKLRPPNAGISDFNVHTYTTLPGLRMAATLFVPRLRGAMNKNNVTSPKGCFSLFFFSFVLKRF